MASDPRAVPEAIIGIQRKEYFIAGDLFRLNDLSVEEGRTLDPIIVCNKEHRFLVAEQIRSVGVETGGILLESAGRNTAPGLTVAAKASQEII